MLRAARRSLALALRGPCATSSAAGRSCLHIGGSQPSAARGERPEELPRAFDPALLEFLVCPLSKKPLRYQATTNELINEDLGIAYPIIDGIPNMIPQAARTTREHKKQEEMEQH
ncbi:protein preY, mitochondrial [Thomomys bottae]